MKADKEQIREFAYELGFELVGFCDAEPPKGFPFYENWLQQGFHGSMDYMQNSRVLRSNPAQILPEVKSVLVVALNYYQPNKPQAGQPRIAKYALGRDYHKVIRHKLKKLAKWLETQYPDKKFRPCVDSVPIFEREYAQKAGLGWSGKHTCLINTHRGSWFLLGILLTTLTIEPDQPAVGGCGTCTRCIDACPTDAIVHENGRWQVNSTRCISYLTIEYHGEIPSEMTSKMGDWTFGCDICQDVCPFNYPREHQPLRSKMTEEEDFINKYKWPSLKELTEISYEQWDKLTRGSPVRRAGWQGLKRNTKINLDNLTKKAEE